MKKVVEEKTPACKQMIRAVKDTQDIIGGKWKVQVISALQYRGTLRFMDLLREVEGIAPKMLSKELKELELNALIEREVMKTQPITVEYKLTEHGLSLKKVIEEMAFWGSHYRTKVFNG